MVDRPRFNNDDLERQGIPQNQRGQSRRHHQSRSHSDTSRTMTVPKEPQRESRLSNPPISPHLDYFLKIFGFATAVTFGIWAPYSFWVSTKWNIENDAVQNALLSHVATIASAVSTAAVLPTAAACADADTRLKNLEILAALRYCDGKAEILAVCKQLTAGADYSSLISSIGSLPTGKTVTVQAPTPNSSQPTSSTSKSTSDAISSILSPTASPSPGSESMGYPPLPPIMEKRRRSQGKTVAYACGIVFITILVLGFILWVFCVRKRVG